MVIKKIFSGEEELTESNYQTELLGKATYNLQKFNASITLELHSGEKIIISKVLEGSDHSTRLLAVTIK
jgi:hypothetical protein